MNAVPKWFNNNKQTYVIAEMSANHCQNLAKAKEIVAKAKEAGADAIKVQAYSPESLTIACDKKWFQIGDGSLWSGKNLFELYREAATPMEWLPKIKYFAEDAGLEFFATAFDFGSVDFLEEMNVPFHKIASFEIVDIALVKKAASTGKPLIISTGMASLSEIEEAVDAATKAGARSVSLMKCTSAYPALPEDMHLNTIRHMAKTFGVPVGLSDHTLGIAVSVAAVMLGATFIEKHLCLSRQDPGPDSGFSLEPHEFTRLVEEIRVAEKAAGQVHYGITPHEKGSLVFRRSLFAVTDVEAGEVLTHTNIRSIRPGHGLAPKYLDLLIGRKAACRIERGTPINWSHIGAA